MPPKVADEEYKTGPFSLLYEAAHDPKMKVLINCRNGKKIIARVRSFDHHFNMLLEDTSEVDATSERSLGKLLLRGDGVILVVKVPS
jgi:small nuclear ribonucleoprotein D2